MTTPPINSFGTIPLPTAEAATDPIHGIDDGQPLTVGQLKAILADFKGSVEHALARQERDLEERFGSGGLPEPGQLTPGDDPNDADHFSATPDSNRYSGQRTVKSTVNIPADLHAKLKRYGIEQGVGAGLSLQTQLTIAIEEYLAKRGL